MGTESNLIGVYYSPNELKKKSFHRRLSLDLIHFTPGGISRAELARQLNISRSAVSAIINDLLLNEVVREAASGPASGGRRPILLEINPQRGFVAGIDIGATHTSILVADFASNIYIEREFPFDIHQNPEFGLEQIDRWLQEALATVELTVEQLFAVGVGMPAPVIPSQGAVCAPPDMPEWDDFPIQSTLERKWNCPVTLNNDAELGALGEWAHGAARGETHLAYIKVGTGIGAGLLFNGRIYRGVNGAAGEIGHITIIAEGPVCTCGSCGCLEALAGGKALARQAQEAVRAGKRTLLSNVHPLNAITGKDIVTAARQGDLVAQQILTSAGDYLGKGIADLVNLFNPGLVVVGGGLAQVGDLLLEPIRRTVSRRCLPSTARNVRITAAVLGRRSTSMGAVVQALTLVFDQLVAH